MLIDSVEVTFKAGKGGDGIVSWRREKFVPKGGPDGGDGGAGGSIFLVASNNMDTLSSFRYRDIFQAEDGENGKGKKMTGKGGRDLDLLVPTGTIVTEVSSDQTIVDLTQEGDRFLISKGGKGGLGNVHFKTSTHQKPTEFTEGKPGHIQHVVMKLK